MRTFVRSHSNRVSTLFFSLLLFIQIFMMYALLLHYNMLLIHNAVQRVNAVVIIIIFTYNAVCSGIDPTIGNVFRFLSSV